jgi:hypothetical protein
MHGKRIDPRTAFRGQRPVRRTLSGGVAKRRHPGEREHIEVEFAGLVLLRILASGGTCEKREGEHENKNESPIDNVVR